MRILGVEGTAWAASASVYDSNTDSVFIETDAYQPESGGIHPREAAEHMSEAIPRVIETALSEADGDIDTDELRSSSKRASPVDAVAFSRGPGLGPCLRIVGTAARALSQTLDVPLVGVNHMVAHLEIGRQRSGFDSPVCLNASGANAHVLGYRNGRYRVLGETMDTGVGNAIDKFTRHVGWSHPGGPKVEQAAADGEYIDMPYVVKGMDFSFSGIMSAAKQAVDDGHEIPDVCFSLQENIFAMLTEVAERALSLTGRDELVLGGGVGNNARLREMLAEMCEQRGAKFYAPEPRFLSDNAGMIAVLGAEMVAAGDTIPVAESAVNSNFRPDQVAVSWRGTEAPDVLRHPDEREVRGAEATVDIGPERVEKRRTPKSYRHPELDATLRKERTTLEARLTSDARRAGVPTPVVYDIDLAEFSIEFERVGEADLRDELTADRVRDVGRHLGTLHREGIVHGDPTTRNFRCSADRTYAIDFGLGYYSDDVEDYAMDLHVFSQSLAGTADDAEDLQREFESAYEETGDDLVLDQLREIEGRGRYQ
ncbi:MULTISPECIES: bifunctional N(6)-L-threonylcarbamoyladenine synthase/serine/threonine protein kinase [unclassified Haladaptatus]|uniref:bifunctional N(6)-L-threonylcarbamoyladenine synthase/serine/threonine protein kinase n=1 Tax=unclassified Haladaptatus TaxID=2622732 RepID=UPI00209C3DED|nr:MULTISPECIES: bifunctional N(6)-L-threonylcarbamoyladenine synthase/serine/threonine protein kinase [unclassified Haladaptatus]MCO8243013.1 bifunctional N(6)-L-threonylcarbamoyladenine synthase/serine/threonine protein kinase [Haladaptatus sp. AB643]MCO8252727.1 bifunctional N(6)-L-threonylcarbamoyladenine synthase/serine/threonine protein kinase [Haladaptatus sp. AB618]